MGIIHECGGKMHMAERQWAEAATDFFEAFKNYDEAGNQRRIQCLKYTFLNLISVFVNAILKIWPTFYIYILQILGTCQHAYAIWGQPIWRARGKAVCNKINLFSPLKTFYITPSDCQLNSADTKTIQKFWQWQTWLQHINAMKSWSLKRSSRYNGLTHIS